jgi:hypothetical protein
MATEIAASVRIIAATKTPTVRAVWFFLGPGREGREGRSRAGACPLILKLQPKRWCELASKPVDLWPTRKEKWTLTSVEIPFVTCLRNVG